MTPTATPAIASISTTRRVAPAERSSSLLGSGGLKRSRWVRSENNRPADVGERSGRARPPARGARPWSRSRRSRADGCGSPLPSTSSKIAGITQRRRRPGTASTPGAVAAWAVELLTASRPSPPTNIAAPSTSRTLPMIEPTIEALTTSCRPSPSANRAMISSGALPNVTFSRPPIPGPERAASSSVARPISAAVGMIPSAATKKIRPAEAPAISSAIAIGMNGTSRYGQPCGPRMKAQIRPRLLGHPPSVEPSDGKREAGPGAQPGPAARTSRRLSSELTRARVDLAAESTPAGCSRGRRCRSARRARARQRGAAEAAEAAEGRAEPELPQQLRDRLRVGRRADRLVLVDPADLERESSR